MGKFENGFSAKWEAAFFYGQGLQPGNAGHAARASVPTTPAAWRFMQCVSLALFYCRGPAYRISDQDALTIINQLLNAEGLFLGLSAGIKLAGAMRIARERGPGQNIVTLLSDSGHKYQSKLFNPDWLAAHQLDPRQDLNTLFETALPVSDPAPRKSIK